MVSNWSTKELKTGPIEQYIATNNDVFSACCRGCPTHTELPKQWRFREINASNEKYCRPSSLFDSFMMRICYGICFRWPQGNIRWVYTPLINLEIAYDNLEFQVVVWFQVVVQHRAGVEYGSRGCGVFITTSTWPAVNGDTRTYTLLTPCVHLMAIIHKYIQLSLVYMSLPSYPYFSWGQKLHLSQQWDTDGPWVLAQTLESGARESCVTECTNGKTITTRAPLHEHRYMSSSKTIINTLCWLYADNVKTAQSLVMRTITK